MSIPPSFSKYWSDNTKQIGHGLDRAAAYEKVLKNFKVLAQINGEGKTVTYYKDGTMDLDTSRTWRAARGVWNTIVPRGLQSDYNDHIDNLKVFTSFLEEFADDCPLNREQAKALIDEMEKAKGSLKVLLQFYQATTGKTNQANTIEHLRNQIDKLEAKIQRNAERKEAHDYYHTKVMHLKDKPSEEIVNRLSDSIIAESPEDKDKKFPVSKELRSMGILNEKELTTFLAEYELVSITPELLKAQRDKVLKKRDETEEKLSRLKENQEEMKAKELEEAAKKKDASSTPGTPQKISLTEQRANALKERTAKKLQESIEKLEAKFTALEAKCIALDAKIEDAEEAQDKVGKLIEDFKQDSKLKSSEQREEFIKNLKKTNAFPETVKALSKEKSIGISPDMFKASPEQERTAAIAKILAQGVGAVAMGFVGYRYESMFLDYAAKMGDSAVRDFVTVLSGEKVEGTSLPMTEDISALINVLKTNPSDIIAKMNQIRAERTKNGEKIKEYTDKELIPIFQNMANSLAAAEKKAEG